MPASTPLPRTDIKKRPRRHGRKRGRKPGRPLTAAALAARRAQGSYLPPHRASPGGQPRQHPQGHRLAPQP
jgi:hypothetical protein